MPSEKVTVQSEDFHPARVDIGEQISRAELFVFYEGMITLTMKRKRCINETPAFK